MKKFFSLPKKALLSSAILGSIVGLTAAAVGAWGPERPTFTVANPAPYVTFNSITDNPNYGDERTFYDVKDAANQSQGGFTDRVEVKDGQKLLLRTYVHNNASENLNGPNNTGAGVAKNTKVRVHVPTATADALRSNSYVSADNANPGVVNDTVDFYSNSGDFSLDYVEGSARAYTNSVPAGYTVADSIVSTGAPVGYTGANGTIPGCFEYTAIVTVEVTVKMAPKPNVGVYKTVRETPAEGAPKPAMQKSITSTSGKSLDYVVSAKNLGNQNLNNVYLRDQLPKGVTYVPGSAKKTYGEFKSTPMDDTEVSAFFTGKKNVGTLLPGAEAFITFKATIDDPSKLNCGVNTIKNIAVVDTDQTGEYNSDATVVVNKDCANVASYTCDLFKVTSGASRTVTVSEFKTSQNNATFKDVVVNWGDTSNGSNNLVTNSPVGQKHQYAADGTYTITAVARFTVNGETKESTSPVCVQKVTFKGDTPVTTVSTGKPTELPNTGAGDVAAFAAMVSVAGAVAHRLVLARRF